MTDKATDKNGRAIERGDVLKVFHYMRGKTRMYMYKQAIRYEKGRLLISHLNRIDDTDGPWKIGINYYSIAIADLRPSDYEIIQSLDAEFERRPRKVAQTENASSGGRSDVGNKQ